MTSDPLPIGEDDLQAFVDDRLAGPRLAAVQAWLETHPDVARRIAAEREQRALLRERFAAIAAEPIPARLHIANLRAAQRARWRAQARRVAFVVLIFGAGLVLGIGLDRLPRGGAGSSPPATASVTEGATAAFRTFVVEVAHPVEVGAAQEAHLLQWLSKRLGRKLAAPDLSAFGYRLVGGRLLPATSGAAAQLMYEDGAGKRLTLYVRAADGTETAFRFQRDGDTASFAWIDQGFGFAVTAVATREELLPIAQSIYRSLGERG